MTALSRAPPLVVSGLCKRYGDTPVLDQLSFSLTAGECFGLLGPNGAGKTTTLRLCLGLAMPDAGLMCLAGYPVPRAARPARAKVGVVPQFDNLDPDFTVRENLLVFARYFGISSRAMAARAPDLLRFAGLEHKAGARINTLSGGMRRRLTLARALVGDPEVLFLDEPTTGLDPQARRLVWERLGELKRQGKTLLLTTHFMDEAERLCDHLMILDKGKAIAEGSPAALIARHIGVEVVEVSAPDLATLAAFVVDWQRQGMPGMRVEHGANLAGDDRTRDGASDMYRYGGLGASVNFHGEDATLLVTALAAHGEFRFLRRAANLEDVFISLTGRELRD
jgi:lipooligosaccharide transport system ATP-binding protein